MMQHKFSQLIHCSWRIMFDGKFYHHKNIQACLLHNLEQWEKQNITFNKQNYVVCVGFNSLHYFLYTILASVLDLKVIFTSAQQLENLQIAYPGINVQYVISPRSIQCKDILLIKINFDVFDYAGDKTLLTNDINQSGQANIVFFTSGTTGKFKLVQYQESKLYDNADVVGNYFGFSEADVCLCVFPVNYMYGFSMLFSMLLKGGTVILERSTIAPTRIVKYLNDSKITVLPILRDMVEKIAPIISANHNYYPNLIVINAADKIYKKQVQKILTFAPIFWNNFGQTESGPRLFAIKITCHTNLEKCCYRDVVAIGYPVHPDIIIDIRDESGHQVDAEVVGHLYYKTEFSMQGYLLADGSCAPASQWQCSGDLVFQDHSGLVYWAGRKAQSVKINGMFVNINLLHHAFDIMPEVKQSYFLYDEDINQIYGYFIVDQSIDKINLHRAVIDRFRREFPQYPRLSQIYFISQFPKTNTGKIDIRMLKELAVAC